MSVARNVLLALAVTAVTCVMTAGASEDNFTGGASGGCSGPSPFRKAGRSEAHRKRADRMPRKSRGPT